MDPSAALVAAADTLADTAAPLFEADPEAVAIGVALGAERAVVATIADDGTAIRIGNQDARKHVEAAGRAAALWLNELDEAARRAIGEAVAQGASTHLFTFGAVKGTGYAAASLALVLERDGVTWEIARVPIRMALQ
jgi:hypothetical protein